MKHLTINIEKGGYQEKNGVTKFSPFPDVRPLSDRIKRGPVNKYKDKNQGVLFINDMRIEKQVR